MCDDNKTTLQTKHKYMKEYNTGIAAAAINVSSKIKNRSRIEGFARSCRMSGNRK